MRVGWENMCEVSELVGKTLSAVTVNERRDELVFEAEDGTKWLMYHEQDCCEGVSIEDICGDLDDLVGSPILLAEEVSSDGKIDPDKSPHEHADSWTWTFYKFATNKGSVTIRWLGESNGYYSESVDFGKL